MDLRRPTAVYKEFWIRAVYEEKDNARSGKWMLFVPTEEIDRTWERIRDATMQGLLGCSAKVATMRENSNAKRSDKKLICVYVSDYKNAVQVATVLAWLRRLGFTARLNFKTDKATLRGDYAFNSNKPVSLYTSPENTYGFNRPGSKEIVYEFKTTEVTCAYCDNLVTIPAARMKDDLSDPLYSERVLCGTCRQEGVTWDDVVRKEEDDDFTHAMEKDE